MIIPSEEIAYRYDFSILCNARGYLDAVEVGVDLGVFARDFLTRFKGNWLLGIDDYASHPDFPHDRTADMLVAIQALAPFHGHFRLVRARSLDAAPWVSRVIRPQFVYVDASHEEQDVLADLETWWNVLAPEGMLAGHDHDADHPGVVRAVERFASERGLTVRLTHEKTAPPSFYIYKTEPMTLFHRFFRDDESLNPCQPSAV